MPTTLFKSKPSFWKVILALAKLGICPQINSLSMTPGWSYRYGLYTYAQSALAWQLWNANTPNHYITSLCTLLAHHYIQWVVQPSNLCVQSNQMKALHDTALQSTSFLMKGIQPFFKSQNQADLWFKASYLRIVMSSTIHYYRKHCNNMMDMITLE